MASIAHIIRRRRRRKSEKRAKRSQNRFYLALMILLLLALLIGPLGVIIGSVGSAYARALDILPTPQETINLDPIIRPTEIYDSSGQTLLFSVEDAQGDEREWVPLNELPTYLLDATLLWEDSDFLSTTRFNLLRAIGKLWTNWTEGPLDPDVTLTGRLVRNLILPNAGEYLSVEDRALEIALVSEINRLYSPREVLEWHLNTNYYGNQAYGIEAASRIYFGKSARDLSLDEVAMLVSIPTAPQYNPVDDEPATRTRQSDVLRRLLAGGMITQAQFAQVSNTVTPILPNAVQAPLVAPEFAVYAQRQAEDILNLIGLDGARLVTRGGLHITTTLDLDLYYQSECALRAHLERLAGQSAGVVQTLTGEACITADFLPAFLGDGGASPPNTGIIVVLDPNTGEILSMNGDATTSVYQPGPVLRPFVYLDAFRDGEITASTMVLDVYQTFPGEQEGLIYIPNNLDGEFRGPMNLRDAMSIGLLPPAVQIANLRGINNVLSQTVHPLGFPALSELVYNLSLLERGGAVSVLDTAYLYSVFASMGYVNGLFVNNLSSLPPGLRSHDPIAVRRIEDAEGTLLWEYDPSANRSLRLEAGLAFIFNNILADNAPRRTILGQDNVLEMSRPSAVVNGMTTDRVDNWTIGYTPQLVTAVHLSRENGAVSLSPYAPEGAASVWRAVSEYAHVRNGLLSEDWLPPPNIITVAVCDQSGLLPNDVCPSHNELFLDGTAPTEQDSYWQSYVINRETGQRATSNTPSDRQVQEVYFIPPPEAEEWWESRGLPVPPIEYDNVSRPEILSSAVILNPQPLQYVGGLVDIRGGLNPTDMQYYQVRYGRGLAPTTWIDITGQITEFSAGTSLATWDTTGLDGLYTLQLRVVYNDNTITDSSAIQVTVDNLPPTITLTTATPDATYTFGVDESILIRAIVQDNILIDNVVFYTNGQYVGERDDCHLLPDECGFEFQITRPGVEAFTAVIADAVGNTATAELTIDVGR